jgi:RNA polymerase sigma-32 factor
MASNKLQGLKMHQSLAQVYSDNYHGYLSTIRQYPILTEEEELILARDVFDNKSRESAEKLVVSHLRLVAKIAFTMRGYGIALMDLIGEGSLGLMHAVKKFNPNIGVRFSGYAKLWIKAYIQEYIIKTWSLVKLGTTIAQKKLFFHLRKAKESILSIDKQSSLSQENYETIAKNLSVSRSEVKEMDLRLGGDMSLDQENEDEEGNKNSLLSRIADKNQSVELEVSESQDKNLQKTLVEQALDKLTPRQAEIIRCRHLKDKADTLEVLSKKYNVSRERIRQIENDAMAKVKEFCLEQYSRVV